MLNLVNQYKIEENGQFSILFMKTVSVQSVHSDNWDRTFLIKNSYFHYNIIL